MDKKPKKDDSLEAAIKMLVQSADSIGQRLDKLENPQPVKEMANELPTAPKPKWEMELPYKAKEILNREFPEAKIHDVRAHKGGYMIILDLTDITGGKWVTASRPTEDGGKETYQNFERDYRNVPVEAMKVEKSIVDRVKKIKENLGWIKTEPIPQQIKRELKPEERPMPQGVKGTPEEEFFTSDVK